MSQFSTLVPVDRVLTAPPVSTTTVPSRARAARNSLVLAVKSVSISPCVSAWLLCVPVLYFFETANRSRVTVKREIKDNLQSDVLLIGVYTIPPLHVTPPIYTGGIPSFTVL